MQVRNLQPNKRIASYVDKILVIENNRSIAPFVMPLYANGVPTILFKSENDPAGNDPYNHITLFGQTIRPDHMSLHGKFTLIAYFFKPYSLLPLFGVAPGELTDQPIDIHLLKPAKTRVLEEKLLNTASVSEMLFFLDSYIIELIENAKEESSLIKYASTRIAHQPTKESLVAVQKDLHLTERTFQRLFEKNIGINPNTYRRICQFNNAFWQLNGRNFDSLAGLAYKNGYADQSHYIRAFREFTHITPMDYLHLGSA